MGMKAGTALISLALVWISGAAPAQYEGGAMSPPSPPETAAPATPGGTGGAGGMMMGQGGMPMGDMSSMMSMMQTMHPSIAVDDSAVYVVRGNQVVKLDKNTLRVLATGLLPAPPQSDMQGMHGMQGMPGMGGMGGAQGMGPGSGPGRRTPAPPASAMERPGMMSALRELDSAPADRFDLVFLKAMTRHHAGAIVMSRLALSRATRPELRRFARGVIDDQTRQNRQFSIWLRTWYQTSVKAVPMPMDQQMINRLRRLRGRSFDVEYMRMMIRHHREAVSMGNLARQKGQRQELRSAAARIMTAQTQEVNTLRGWLSQWYDVR